MCALPSTDFIWLADIGCAEIAPIVAKDSACAALAPNTVDAASSATLTLLSTISYSFQE